MFQFIIAILLCLVVSLISRGICLLYLVKYKLDEKTLGKKLGFQLAAVVLVISWGLFWINLTILIAYLIKTYLL